MAAFNHISGAEPSTITFKAATVTQTRNSSLMHQEIVSLGDPESSLGIAAILGAAPASTTFALVVRRVGDSTSIIHGDSTVFQGSSAWQVQVTNQVRVSNSTAADFNAVISGNSTVAPLAGSVWSVAQVAGSTWNVRALNSSAGDFLVTVSGNSTVAPLAGSAWVVRSSKADALGTVYQSTAADLQATVTQASSLWQVQVSNGNSSVTISAIAAGAGRLNIGSTAADNAVSISGNSTVAPLAGSTWNTRPLQSSAADLQMTATPAAGSTWNVRALQSSAADFQVTATPVSGSTWATRPIQSSAADLQVTATIGVNLQSTTAPSSNSSGLIVRQVVDNILTVSSTTLFASTVFSIQSSAAGLRSYVVAYSILTTNAGPARVRFYSGSTLLWPMLFAAVSSAVSGANLAVSAPAYLFRTKVAGPLSLQLGAGASTVAGFHGAISYFRAV